MKKKKLPLALGLMSGTSMDAIDAALVEIRGNRDQLLLHTSVPYPSALKKRLMKLLSEYQAPIAELALIHRDVGQAFAAVAERCLQEAERKKICKPSDVQIIGSHGQTIFHSPQDHTTWQIGESTWISSRLGLPVVSDFRTADMACDGEGAPLLPWYHRRLFARKNAVSIHNLGGISNFTYLGERPDNIWGGDTGPANCWIDSATFQIFGKSYDADGRLAKQGRVNHKLLRQIQNDPKIHRFLEQAPPKSTGRELFSEQKLKWILNQAQKESLSKEDILATITEFTAVSIAHAYSRWVLKKLPLEEIIFCGGGAKNSFLLCRIRHHLPKVKISKLEDFGYSSAALEAQAFAVYAWMWKKNIPINCPTVTGANRKVVCGKLTPAI